MKRVCHISSAHIGLDVRIFHKMCVSAAAAGFDTHLVIVATDHEVRYAASKSVKIHSLRQSAGRLSRMIVQTWRCYSIARSLDADIYHFHDPEFIPFGILLAILGKNVVYDVHEDVPRDILIKGWIPLALRRFISTIVGFFEHFSAKYFFSISAATPFISKRFEKIGNKVVNINNYPIISEIEAISPDYTGKKRQVCYLGGISNIRGIKEVVQAMNLLNYEARLQLGGEFGSDNFYEALQNEKGWDKVDYLGWLSRDQVAQVLRESVAGLVTLHPIVTYIDSLPVKMFEYMAAGLPVIASDFPAWKEIIESNRCGICVNPMDPVAISKAVDYLFHNPEQADSMGKNGKNIVSSRYNWAVEETKLLCFYRELLIPLCIN